MSDSGFLTKHIPIQKDILGYLDNVKHEYGYRSLTPFIRHILFKFTEEHKEKGILTKKEIKNEISR